MVEDDEDLIEAELQKIRPTSKESSVESLIADNPGMYIDENLMKGKKLFHDSSTNQMDSEIVEISKSKRHSPNRNDLTDKDKQLARAYGGKPRGSVVSNYRGQPKRIKKEDTKEMFPSLIVQDQARDKLSRLNDSIFKGDNESDAGTTKFDKREELRRKLEKLKQEHFKDFKEFDSDNLGELNMDLIDEKLNEFDYNRQIEYEKRMKANMASNMHNNTSSHFYRYNKMPFQSSDLLPSNADSRITSSKNHYQSRIDTRPRTKQISGLRRIYGNLGEIVVPTEDKERDRQSRLHSPGSTLTLRSGFSRQPTQSKFESNSRIRGLEMIYLQKLENHGKGKKPSNNQRKAKFRTLLNKYVDDPSVLIADEMSFDGHQPNSNQKPADVKVSRYEFS